MAKKNGKEEAVATPEANNLTVTAEYNKTTKRMYRYQTPEGAEVQASVYVPRESMGDKPLPTIEVVVSIPSPSIHEPNPVDGF